MVGNLAVRLTARHKEEPPSTSWMQDRSNMDRVDATVRRASIGVAWSGSECMIPQTTLGRRRLARSQSESISSSFSAGRRWYQSRNAVSSYDALAARSLIS